MKTCDADPRHIPIETGRRGRETLLLGSLPLGAPAEGGSWTPEDADAFVTEWAICDSASGGSRPYPTPSDEQPVLTHNADP